MKMNPSEQKEKSLRFIRTYFERFVSAKENHWNYVDGCLLNAAVQLYDHYGDAFYKDFILKYYDNYIDEQGNIRYYDINAYNLDSINSGNGLFFAYRSTGDERYRNAIELLMRQLRNQPRTHTGNFWHKQIYPQQVWLDGLYMGLVFYMRYETAFGGKEHYSDILSQFQNVRKYLYDEEKGLHYHACDMARKQPWANRDTGCSLNFWSRACGWHFMALIDTMDAMDASVSDVYQELGDLFREALQGILKYQDPRTGLFYQVIDHPEVPGNYLETSGSAMIAYTIYKACRMKAIPETEYRETADKMMRSLTDLKIREDNGVLRIGDICSGAGLSDTRNGTIEYYLSEPIVYDDHKGAAPYMMACVECEKLENK